MKKLQILLIVFLISLSICAFASMRVKAQTVGVTATATLSSIDRGGASVLSVTAVSGGFPPFNYQWLMKAPGATAFTNIPGATSLTYNFSSSSSDPIGNYQFEVSVTDLVLQSGTSSPVSVMVNSDPTVSVLPASWSMDVDQSKTFLATPSGGSGTYTSYKWYVDSVLQSAQTGSSFIYTPISAGSHSITATVTDSLAFTSIQSPTASVTVAAALVAPTVSASVSSVAQGGTSSLSSSVVSTGTRPYTYQWLERVPGASSYSLISGATSSSYSFVTSSSTATGSWSFELQVNDSASEGVTSLPVPVTVNAIPIVSVTPLSWTMYVGQSQTFTASALGGSGSYPSTGYQWYVGGIAQTGQTLSTFSYSSGSVGSFLITATVTDSLGTISSMSSAAAVTVNALPTVSIAPVGPLSLSFGQVQSFTATPVGGSGSLSYQWYLDGSAVGSNIATYSYAAASGSHQVYVNVTDSASPPYMFKSNVVSITVGSALVAPTVSASVGLVAQGGTSSLSSSVVSTGTSPYIYQWLERVPGASSDSAIIGATSTTYSFVTADSTIPGVWSFKLQVTDAALAVVTSNTVLVTVNSAPLDHFVFSSVGTQIAGTSFSITITAKDALNNTLTNYSGTNNLNVSIGTISPTSTGAFLNGVWTGSVAVTKAGPGIWLIASGSGMSGTSSSFIVNSGVLDHFTFSAISDQAVGSVFTITVTAQDAFNNTVTDYVGTPSLNVSAGSINPQTMGAFVNGVGSTSITLNTAGSNLIITASDGAQTGRSNPFTITLTPTSTPTSSPSQNSTPTPSSAPKPTPTPTPTPTPSIPTPFATIVPATTDSGTTINLEVRANANSSQISNATIMSNQTAKTTTVSFTIAGQEGLSIFNNVTIPKNAVSYGAIPVVLIDDQYASNQGYAQDANNFYVWYTTLLSAHQVKIQFAASSSSQLPISPVVIVGVLVTEIVLIYTAIAVRRLRRKPSNE